MRAADADILIVPGYSGGTSEHWYSRWTKKLSTARRIEQHDWNAPRRADWVDAIISAARRGDRPVIFVAHSLGSIALLHASAHLPKTVAGAFLVASPSPQALQKLIDGIDPESVTNAPLPEDRHIDAAFLPIPRTPLLFPSVLVGSSNDPYADILFQRRLAEDIGAKFIDAGPSGHINVESGHGPWPEGLLSFAGFISKL